MPMRDATREERDRWDELVDGQPGEYSFFQGLLFGEVKEPAWRPRPTVHEIDGRTFYVLYLVRRLPGFGEFWYAPCGPRVTEVADFRAICRDLHQHARDAFAVVMEPAVPAGPTTKVELCEAIPSLQPVADVQGGSHTVFIDLRPSEDDMLAGFRQRARRAIRKAKDAVVDHVDDESAFDDMWTLYQAMGERTGFHLRDKSYYTSFWRTYLDAGQGHFVLARPDADSAPAAGAFLMQVGNDAIYKDGGSLRIPEANGLQYLVQWEAMRWAKQRGATRYDMFGAPPSWAADDETNKRHGLVQFKTAFGEISDTAGAVCLVRQPRLYRLWNTVGRRAFNLMARRTGAQFY